MNRYSWFYIVISFMKGGVSFDGKIINSFCDIRADHPFCHYNCMKQYTKSHCNSYPNNGILEMFVTGQNVDEKSLRDLFMKTSPISRERLIRGELKSTDGNIFQPPSYLFDWVNSVRAAWF